MEQGPVNKIDKMFRVIYETLDKIVQIDWKL